MSQSRRTYPAAGPASATGAEPLAARVDGPAKDVAQFFSRMNRNLLFLAAVLFALAPAASGGEVTLASPNGKVKIGISGDGGRLTYSVSFQEKTAIETSPLGVLLDGTDLGRSAMPVKSVRYRRDESYPWHGVHATAHDRANGLRIALRHTPTGAAYTLDVRAYDNGVAFRFAVPGAAGKRRVPDEATAFRIPAGSTVWFHDFEGHYEGVHRKYAIEEVPAGAWAAPPLTFRLPGGSYGSITEGALFHYSGMGLEADGERGFAGRLGHAHPASYPFRLRYKEDVERLKAPAAIEGEIVTPWRIVMLGADLDALVNCDIVQAVAPPPDSKYFPAGIRTPWVKPGRAVWKYLDGGQNTLEEMRNFSRMAAELGFEYNVIEGFWQKWSPEELKGFVEESRKQGVGIILWKHSKELRDAAARRAFFAMCRDAGVAGAKIDFFDHEQKEVVELYEACLRDAAEFHQVVDFHGANKPTGESRTWPNELTREAIRGMEARKIQRATHDATLPFTRMLAGHADYTPMVFSDRRNDTTWAHQIATAVSFTSPLLVYGAHPKSILENPAVDVIKSVPSVWDETRVLPGSEIGEVAALARRSGKTWFLAVMNGASARSIDVPLSFLDAGRYDAVLVRDDAANPAAVKIQKAAHTGGDSLRVALSPGGGFVARFAPAPKPAPDAATAAQLRHFDDIKFGMFIHWGLYAVPAGEWDGRYVRGNGEWIMFREKIPVARYEQLARQFNPVKFDADAWAQLARDAGMRYMVITSKHHDGFAMFKSNASKYNIVDATAWGQDPMKALSSACARRGIDFGFYYSQDQDWHEPNGRGNDWDFPKERNAQIYLENKVIPQVKEILTGYGKLGLIWFDTPGLLTEDQVTNLRRLVKSEQPSCLINSRIGHNQHDYAQTGDNAIPLQVYTERGKWEVPATLNDTWGYKKSDQNWKQPRDLVAKLADIVSKGGNYLLNVGPTAEGVIPPASQEILRTIGQWLKVNGESIYGTSPSPFFYPDITWRATVKPGKLYLHILNWPGTAFRFEGLENRVKKAYFLANKAAVPFRTAGKGLEFTLPAKPVDPFDTVLVLEMDGEPRVAAGYRAGETPARVDLYAWAARLRGEEIRYDWATRSATNFRRFERETNALWWYPYHSLEGDFEVEVTYACPDEAAGSRFRLGDLEGVIEPTRGEFVTRKLEGTLTIRRNTSYIAFELTGDGKSAPLKLRKITLTRK